MMRRKMITTLAIAALATASIGTTAFAAAKKQAYTVTVKNAAGGGKEIPMSELETNEYGVQTYEGENGVTISIVNADAADSKNMKLQTKTDENGNTYIEMEDGSRVYIAPANSAAVE